MGDAPYFAFNGDFRRKPQQNLGGQTRIGRKEEVVNKAHEERRKREVNLDLSFTDTDTDRDLNHPIIQSYIGSLVDLLKKKDERERLEQFSSLIMQKSVRSFLSRVQWKRQIRAEFDSNVQSEYVEMSLGLQITRLNQFFDPTKDVERLAHVGKMTVLKKDMVTDRMSQNPVWSYRIRIMLRNSVRIINKCHNVTEQSTFIRLIDTMTAACQTHLQIKNERSSYGILWLDLVYYGHFYEEWRILIKSKLVSMNSQHSSTQPLLIILSRPFHLIRQLEDYPEDCLEITRRFLKSSGRFHLSLNSSKGFGNLILSKFIEDFSRDVIPREGASGKFHKMISAPSSSSLSEIFPWKVLSSPVLLVQEDDKNVSPAAVQNFGTSLERNILFLLLSLMNPKVLNSEELDAAIFVISQRIQCVEDKRIWTKFKDPLNDEDMLMDIEEDDGEYNEENREELAFIANLKHETTQLYIQMKQLANELDIEKWLNNGNSSAKWAMLCPILGAMIKLQAFIGGKDELSHIVMKQSGKCRTLMSLFNHITHSTSNNMFIFCWFAVNIINSFHDYELLNKCLSSSDMEFLVNQIKDFYVQSYQSEIDLEFVEGPENKCIYSALQSFHERNTRIEVLSDEMFKSPFLQSVFPYSTHYLSFSHFTIPLYEAANELQNPQEFKLLRILREFPFVLDFQERLICWRRLIELDRNKRQTFEHRQNIHIRRNRIYEDAFNRLSVYDVPDIRANISVSLENPAGLDEAGVDGGGLLREFLTEASKAAVNPNNGLFRLDSQNRFYPSPVAKRVMADFKDHYFFIGRLVGKALYEGTHLELPFSPFFVQTCLTQNVSSSVDYLALLDADLHKHLLELKTYKGDWNSLGLDFTITNNEVGIAKQIELKPGGAEISVDQENVIEYIHLMANYKINKELYEECKWFRRGLVNVIPTTTMFSWKELQLLISGSDKPINIEDWQDNTNYTGGFDPDNPTIKNFWKIIGEFNEEMLGKLLKFVTSCSRPPLQGFKYLNPNFGIQNSVTPDRLPSASTCINLLKLPPIASLQDLKEKLLYAINSEAGFELS